MALTRQEALDCLREAVKALGVVKTAAAAGIPQTHLSTVLSGGRGLGKDTAAKLRPLLPDLDAEVWLAAMGVEADRQEASA